MINTSTLILSSTPIEISSQSGEPSLVINSSNVVVYIGGSNISVTNSIPLAPGESVGFTPDASVWGLVASGTAVITYATGAVIYGALSSGGSVATDVFVTNFPSTQNVAITNFPAEQPVSLPPALFLYGSDAVAPMVTTTLYTTTTALQADLWGFIGSSDGDGLYELQIDGVTVMSGRTNAAQPSINPVSPAAQSVAPGKIISLIVTNLAAATSTYKGALILG
jgi:hypothetical protein